VPLGITTCTEPVVAPVGTEVVIAEPVELTLNIAAVALNVTLVVPVRLVPRIVTFAPTSPVLVCSATNDPKPTFKLKMVPPWPYCPVRDYC
jgi:hypothetical protein